MPSRVRSNVYKALASPRSAIANRQLRRFARKRNLTTRPRQNNPPGKSLKNPSIPSAKNIPLSPSGKSVILIRPSHPMRGAARDRHERAVGCSGREGLRKTNASRCGRRSRVVPTPRRWRQVLEKQVLGNDGGKKARSPRRARNKP